MSKTPAILPCPSADGAPVWSSGVPPIAEAASVSRAAYRSISHPHVRRQCPGTPAWLGGGAGRSSSERERSKVGREWLPGLGLLRAMGRAEPVSGVRPAICERRTDYARSRTSADAGAGRTTERVSKGRGDDKESGDVARPRRGRSLRASAGAL